MMVSNFLLFTLFVLSIKPIFGLECYVCDNQEDNESKCVNTIKTCQQEEDVCLTEVRWGSRPYWSAGAHKQFFISKRCSNKDRCKRFREANMKYCTYIWYEDWRCSDCCKGDRCNYYIISSAERKDFPNGLFYFAFVLSIFRSFLDIGTMFSN